MIRVKESIEVLMSEKVWLEKQYPRTKDMEERLDDVNETITDLCRKYLKDVLDNCYLKLVIPNFNCYRMIHTLNPGDFEFEVEAGYILGTYCIRCYYHGNESDYMTLYLEKEYEIA